LRRTLIIIILVAVASALSMTVYSQEQFKIRGEVTMIDPMSKSITIKPRDKDAMTIILESVTSLGKIKVGDQAQVTYTVKDGANSASKIKKMIDGCN
jgi:Cu/Ag efflux protein CusF